MSRDLAGIKVCFIVGTLTRGGAERQLFYMLRTLLEGGGRPVVLCLTQGDFWESRIRELGIEVFWVGKRRSRLARMMRIIAKVRELRPDIVQSSHFFTNLYAAGAGAVNGIPSIGALRNDCVSEVRDTGRLLGRLCLRAPRMIAGNSRAGISAAMAMGVAPCRLYLLPNVVDIAGFPVARQARREAPVTLLAVGRLVEQKRMDRFIRLIAGLRTQLRAPIKGLIVGDGPLRSKLQELAEGLGLRHDDLEFRGLVTDMPRVYAEADLFLLVSDWEGTPNVVLEAMASGLTVIASKVGGIEDIIAEASTGFVFDMADEQRLLELCKRLIADPQLRQGMGTRAREAVDRQYSLSQLSAYLTSLYQLAMGSLGFQDSGWPANRE